MYSQIAADALGVQWAFGSDEIHWIREAVHPLTLGYVGGPRGWTFTGAGAFDGMVNALPAGALSSATVDACAVLGDALYAPVDAYFNTAVVVVNGAVSVQRLRRLEVHVPAERLLVTNRYGYDEAVDRYGGTVLDQIERLKAADADVCVYVGTTAPLPLPRRALDELEAVLADRLALAMATARLTGRDED